MSGGAGEVGERRTLFCADLNTDAGWAEAAADCDYVLHVASPYPITVPRDENELIMPARDGALRAARRGCQAPDAGHRLWRQRLDQWVHRKGLHEP
jgi:hypothetical protein